MSTELERLHCDVAIIGGGVGGYIAAIRAADLGKKVVLVEEREHLGGVSCLEGCIPSKTLIYALGVAEEARRASKLGIEFGDVHMNPARLRAYTADVVEMLAKDIEALVSKRGIQVIQGSASFLDSSNLDVTGQRPCQITFDNCIIATGAHPVTPKLAANLPVWTLNDALRIPEIPERLLVIGHGFAALEMALLYSGLSSWVTLLEFSPTHLPYADADLLDVLLGEVRLRLESVLIDSKVTSIQYSEEDGFHVTVEHDGSTMVLEADRLLVEPDWVPNTARLNLDKVGITTVSQGHIAVNQQGRTQVHHIFAVGDVTPAGAGAQRASRQGKVAAEVIAGLPSSYDNRAVPAAVYTDPEMAWVGLTEREAITRGYTFRIGRFPLKALGRARTLGRSAGLVKIIAEAGTNLILGVGIVGPLASELIAEAALAIEMHATLENLQATIHPHPTLSEAILEAAEAAAGAPIHVMPS